MLTQSYLQGLLDYDPVTGAFTWRVSHRGTFKGARAGWLEPHGAGAAMSGDAYFVLIVIYLVAWIIYDNTH